MDLVSLIILKGFWLMFDPSFKVITENILHCIDKFNLLDFT